LNLRNSGRGKQWPKTAGSFRVGGDPAAGEPALQAGEAAQRAHLGPDPAGDARRCGRRDVAARDGGPGDGERPAKIRGRAQRTEVEAEDFGWAGRGERCWQKLQGERAQQTRLAVEQTRKPRRVERLRDEVGDAPPGVADAGRAAARIAGAALHKAPARIALARAGQNRIRTKRLIRLDFASGIQAGTGRITQLAGDFEHWRGLPLRQGLRCMFLVRSDQEPQRSGCALGLNFEFGPKSGPLSSARERRGCADSGPSARLFINRVGLTWSRR
jgi:hypothetical protein